MTQFEKLLILALADLAATTHKCEPKEIIRRWTEQADKTWPRTVTNGDNLPPIPQADIDAIYAAYPTKDPNNSNRRVGKSAKDKDKIRKLLEEGHTKEELLDLIEKTKTDGRWLKDLSTWLNNLPDFDDPSPRTPEPKKEEYRLRW